MIQNIYLAFLTAYMRILLVSDYTYLLCIHFADFLFGFQPVFLHIYENYNSFILFKVKT